MSADIEIEDVEDALKRADEYAKLMGRTKKNIVADLLDDGQLNFSAGSDSKSVLDRATDQAKKLQGLLTTLVPIIALLLSIGAEGFGIVDLTGWDFIGDEDNDEDPIYIYGCMNDKALNYDENATRDDDSCEYAPPPEPDGPGCEPHIYDVQFLYTDSNNDTVKARFDVDCTNSGVTERITVFFSAWMPNTTPETGDEPVNQTTVWAEVEGTATDYYSVSLGNFEAGVYDLYFILYDANGTVVDGGFEENRWIENPGELEERENERERESKFVVNSTKDKKVNLLKLPKVTISGSPKMLDKATEAQIKFMINIGVYQGGVEYTKALASEAISNAPAFSKNIQFFH